jgi:hypothetical protein
VWNAVVVETMDISRSLQPYPEGGEFGGRGSGNSGRCML